MSDAPEYPDKDNNQAIVKAIAKYMRGRWGPDLIPIEVAADFCATLLRQTVSAVAAAGRDDEPPLQ
jgi:hypothetical protein